MRTSPHRFLPESRRRAWWHSASSAASHTTRCRGRSSKRCTSFACEVLTAALSGNKKHAEHFIPVWDDWTHRLQVVVFLREGNLTAYRRMKARVFRDRLEFLKHAIEEGDRDETREYVGLVNRAYGRMRLAYLQ